MAGTHIPLAAEPVFTLGSFVVTNTLVSACVATLVFVLIAFGLRGSSAKRPGRFQLFVEMVLEGIMGFFDQVTHDRAKTRKFLPFVGTLFLFILVSNWMGLLPGTGSIGVWHLVGGEREFIPLLRPANSDLNLTLVMALLTIVGSHVLGVASLGWWVHLNKFIQIQAIVKAIASFSPIQILTALVEFIVGIIELFGEVAKIASLSLRLFGNVFAGEVLITVIASLVAYFAPLPFMALEILVGMVQAVVFSTLTLVYLTIMTMVPHGHHEDEHGTESIHAVPSGQPAQ